MRKNSKENQLSSEKQAADMEIGVKTKMLQKEKVKTKSEKIAQIIEEKGLGNLRKLGLSDIAIIIAGRMEYLFEKYRDGFDKHGNDCADQNELPGECWTKELPISKTTFKKYLKEIALTHNSPEEYSKARWKFSGKFYCCVLDEANHKRTRHLRNHKLARIIKAVLEIDYSEDSNNLDMGLGE